MLIQATKLNGSLKEIACRNTSLDVATEHRIMRATAEEVSAAVKRHEGMKSLRSDDSEVDFSHAMLDSRAIWVIASNIESSTKLRKLDISYNELSKDDGLRLVSAVEK